MLYTVILHDIVTLCDIKGSYDAISSFTFSLECYKLFCIDKIPEVAKTKVLK